MTTERYVYGGKESNYKSSKKTFVFGLGQTDFEINVDYTHVHSNIYNSRKMEATQCPFTHWAEWINYMWSIHAIENCSLIMRNEEAIHATM